jgi:hypothetical protein
MRYKSSFFILLALFILLVSSIQSANAKAKSAVPPALDAYEVALTEGINFSNPEYPSFIEGVSGMSGPEAWGRWSDGKEVVFTFKNPFPQKFELIMKASVLPANVGKLIPVSVGKWSENLKMTTESTDYTLHVKTTGKEKEIRITIPNPAPPGNGDLRNLGIRFVSMKIIIVK